ncbi:MAG: hypothetical protein D6694_01970, partial [Gammaproteobacteria bacterium]
ATYGGLRLFSEQLPSVADRLDGQVIEEFAEAMADVFGDPSEQIRAELREFFPALDEDHLYPDFMNDPNVREAFAAFRDTAFRRRVLKWERENPRKKHRFLAAWTDYMAQPPISGIVLRQSALINLVSTLEIFVDGVVKIYREQVDPGYAIKKIPNWKDRWDALQKIVPSPLWQGYQAPLREIIARRNALIHQGGRITAGGYLKQTREVTTLRPPGAAEGWLLLVPTSYLQEAFDTVILFAFALSQFAWREWRKPRRSQIADKLASDFLYQTLRPKRHALVERLASIAVEVRPGWKYRQTMLVNWAIACREQGKGDEMNRVLAQLEARKKHRQETKAAIHILRQRFDQARALMKAMAEKGELNKRMSPYWPLFEPIRDKPWLNNLFKASYGTLPRSRKRRQS